MQHDIVLVDLDHTLSDARWRNNMIKDKMTKEDWREYHVRCYLDPVFEPVANVVRALRLMGTQIYVVTAREEYVRHMTHEWMTRHRIPMDALFMRSVGDATPSARLKAKQIVYAVPTQDLARIKLIIDDREDVIEEFARLGICGLKVVMS